MTLLSRFKQITTFILDIDGVMTDGTVYLLEDGQQVRGMSTRDGYALQLAIKKGYRIMAISGGNSYAVTLRLNKLGVAGVHLNVHDKKQVLLDYIQQHQLNRNEILYMGDDIPDYSVMLEVGLPCAPADAVEEIKKIALYISSVNGGRGCVRDVIEKVLKLNGHWELNTNVASK